MSKSSFRVILGQEDLFLYCFSDLGEKRTVAHINLPLWIQRTWDKCRAKYRNERQKRRGFEVKTEETKVAVADVIVCGIPGGIDSNATRSNSPGIVRLNPF